MNVYTEEVLVETPTNRTMLELHPHDWTKRSNWFGYPCRSTHNLVVTIESTKDISDEANEVTGDREEVSSNADESLGNGCYQIESRADQVSWKTEEDLGVNLSFLGES